MIWCTPGPRRLKGPPWKDQRIALTALSLPQAWPVPSPSPFLQLGGRAQGWTSSFPSLRDASQRALSDLPHRDHWKPLGFSPGDQIEISGQSLRQPALQILAAFLHIVMPKQKSQLVALAFWRAKSVVLLDKFVQLAFLPDLGLQSMGYSCCGIYSTVRSSWRPCWLWPGQSTGPVVHHSQWSIGSLSPVCGPVQLQGIACSLTWLHSGSWGRSTTVPDCEPTYICSIVWSENIAWELTRSGGIVGQFIVLPNQSPASWWCHSANERMLE